jgi:hypothetical protein
MKKIFLHSGAIDAALQFVDAGNFLTIGEAGHAGTIGGKEAAALVESGRAIDADKMSDPDGLDAQTVPQLQVLAEGVVVEGTRKQDYIDAIRAARRERVGAQAMPAAVPAPGSGQLPGETDLPIVQIKDPSAEGGVLRVSARGIVPPDEVVEVDAPAVPGGE